MLRSPTVLETAVDRLTHGEAAVVGYLAGVADFLIDTFALFAEPFVIKNAEKK